MICEKKSKIYSSRIELFIKELSNKILSESLSIKAVYGHSVDAIPFNERLTLEYQPISEGEQWGKTWESAWFNVTGVIPQNWANKNVVAQLDFNGEALIFSNDGHPLQGLTNGSIFERGYTRDIFPLTELAKGGEKIDLWIEAAAFSRFGVNRDQDPVRTSPTRHGTYSGKVNKLRLAVFEAELYALWLDLTILLELYGALDQRSTQASRILRGLSKAIDTYADNINNTSSARAILKPLLEQKANASSVTAIAVGHAHIDTGWLWPVKETIRKCARTFANQLGMLEQYPDYIFGASQPAHYEMIKENYPTLYEEIKSAVKEGRWELQGGMWVEADCNITGGESLIRQFIHGKNYFMDEFAYDVKNLWLPDVFGYSASLPQIMKKAGVDYFLSQKICWSQYNKFPHTTFNWRGIDGTEVLTHFLPEEANNYNSRLMPHALIEGEKNFKEKEVLDEMLLCFGVGDGGGGAKPEHLERGMRMQDLESVPKVKFGRADDFFKRLSAHTHELPIWNGELYLENHRGTFTTQALTKRGNRKLELALRETEYLLSCGNLKDYPLKELDRVWKTMLLNQFHDIIPGSSIRKVYEVTEQDYVEGVETCSNLKEELANRIFNKDENSIVVANTLNISFTQSITLPEGWEQVEETETQVESDGTVKAIMTIPPQANIVLTKSNDLVKKENKTLVEKPNPLVLENDLIKYEFTKNGELLNAYDKEVDKNILNGPGNIFTLYEDKPLSNDAWNIEIYYEDQVLENAIGETHNCLVNGSIRQGVYFKLNIGDSIIVQKIYLECNTKRLDFMTEIEWNECHRMLRVAFPTTIQSDQASFDIQYGYAKRPTHRNTSWDMARFEVAAHQYADLSNNNYGVALLNDCKYGYKILENIIDLNLLRSSTHPDPDADIGQHKFTYSLLPHTGDLIHSNVQEQAMQLNQPPVSFPGFKNSNEITPVKVEGSGVVLEVIKRAEKEECLVFRIAERLGCETKANIKLLNNNDLIVEIDLMEWNEIEHLGKGSCEIKMRPFDIRTFKITK